MISHVLDSQPAIAGLPRSASATRHDDEQSVAKPNEAIAIRPKRGKLTLLSRRIYNVLLYHAQQQGVGQPKHSIFLSELIDDARFNSHNTELLKTHIRDMQATTVEWYTSGAGRQRWTSTQLIGWVEIEEPGRGSPCKITWSFPEPIRDKLLVPAQYTRILLEMSSHMRSHAAAVLYELGARYLTSPGRVTAREDVIWWASVLTGRSDIEKVDYRILHRDTIKKALAELDALCDTFRMEVIEHRRGRKVEELQFRVIEKPQGSLAGLRDSARNTFDLALVERVMKLGFKRADAQDLYAATDEGALRAAVEHVEQRLASTALPKIQSPIAYLKDALRKQYAGTIAESTQLAAGSPRPTIESRLERLRDDWRHERATKARRLLSEMVDSERESYFQRFETDQLPSLAGPIVKAWRRDKVNGRLSATYFYGWLAGVLWPGEVTDKDLLEFAISKQPVS